MRFSLAHAVGVLGGDDGWPYTLGGAYAIPYLKNPQTGQSASYPPATASWWASDWATAYAWHREYKSNIPNQKPIAASTALFDAVRPTSEATILALKTAMSTALRLPCQLGET